MDGPSERAKPFGGFRPVLAQAQDVEPVVPGFTANISLHGGIQGSHDDRSAGSGRVRRPLQAPWYYVVHVLDTVDVAHLGPTYGSDHASS